MISSAIFKRKSTCNLWNKRVQINKDFSDELFRIFQYRHSRVFYILFIFSVGVKYSNILNPYKYLKLSVTTNTYNLLDVLMGFKFSFYELSLFITLKMDK